MYRYYLAQIRSPKYYLSHIVLQRRSLPHTLTHNQTSFHCLKIHSHKQHKSTHTNTLSTNTHILGCFPIISTHVSLLDR